MSGPLLLDRVKETTTTTGTGTVTLAGAVSGFRSFGNVGNGNTCYYTLVGGSEWEVGIGTYTSAGTTLSRDKVLASSNSNSLVNFSAGSKDAILTAPASILEPDNGLCLGRLTTESGVAVSTTNRTAQGTIYFTPQRGNRLALWDGSGWRIWAFTERSLALASLTSGKNYDVFIYDSSGTLVLELSNAWTNDTSRADALVLWDGVWCKNADKTRRYLGTFRATGTSTTEDSDSKRFVWSVAQPALRHLKAAESTASWTYTTATWRSANNNSANRVEFVLGLAEALVVASVHQMFTNSVGAYAAAGIGLDATNANSAQVFGDYSGANAWPQQSAHYKGYPGAGYHYLQWLENSAASGTTTWYGNGATQQQSGLLAEIIA